MAVTMNPGTTIPAMVVLTLAAVAPSLTGAAKVLSSGGGAGGSAALMMLSAIWTFASGGIGGCPSGPGLLPSGGDRAPGRAVCPLSPEDSAEPSADGTAAEVLSIFSKLVAYPAIRPALSRTLTHRRAST